MVGNVSDTVCTASGFCVLKLTKWFCQLAPSEVYKAYPYHCAFEALAIPKIAVNTTVSHKRKVFFTLARHWLHIMPSTLNVLVFVFLSCSYQNPVQNFSQKWCSISFHVSAVAASKSAVYLLSALMASSLSPFLRSFSTFFSNSGISSKALSS